MVTEADFMAAYEAASEDERFEMLAQLVESLSDDAFERVVDAERRRRNGAHADVVVDQGDGRPAEGG
jgi:hypothetical protein